MPDDFCNEPVRDVALYELILLRRFAVFFTLQFCVFANFHTM